MRDHPRRLAGTHHGIFAVLMEKRRKFIGFELNPKYFEYAVRNLTDAEAQFAGGNDLLSLAGEERVAL